eukprot:CAMPEP_0117669982 /NCGR_PEP_ID=MMETSP0804-20121206/12464_1 /TAXON_ID=1074897 /ORGANISM="Tetraselmis astigmatica, Strain CCMP880" /LENGTH=162 /DNA_ID=CAMNT_0005478159 /DNA_START=55 /DNA_END=543 /DNA_ORIENTATION=-
MACRVATLPNARANIRGARITAPSARFATPSKGSSPRLASTMRIKAVESDVAVGKVTMIESKDDFSKALSEAGESLVVLDIGSTRCGPCKMVWPKFCAMSEEFEDASFLKINGDTNKETVAMMKEWEVKAVPEFRFFRSGELVHKHSGACVDTLRGHLEEHA